MSDKDQGYGTKIKEWGNSLAVRLPKHIAEKLNLNKNTPVQLEVENGDLKLKPRDNKKYSLEELLSEVNEDNIHKEIETGKPVGNEVW